MSENLLNKFKSIENAVTNRKNVEKSRELEETLIWRSQRADHRYQDQSLKNEIKKNILKRIPIKNGNLNINVANNISQNSRSLNSLYKLIMTKEFNLFFKDNSDYANLNISVENGKVFLEAYILLKGSNIYSVKNYREYLKEIKKITKSNFKLIYKEHSTSDSVHKSIILGFECRFYEAGKINFNKSRKGPVIEVL